MLEFNAVLVPFDPSKALPIEIHCTGTLIIEHQKVTHVEICFELTGAIEGITLAPEATPPKRSNNLWQTTCFEFFVKAENSTRYWEYNLSPSCNWATYGFSDYRKNKFDELSISNINIDISAQAKCFKLRSLLPLPKALINNNNQNLELGISSVIQDENDNIYYYALKHAKTYSKENPDFHDKNSFIISTAMES